ncbi:MAG: thiamine pyrophosphate-binding protein [Pseudolabrys sp.]|nr:thiamine pyrophosphate-binding protein [Pseudolabrys sp.]
MRGKDNMRTGGQVLVDQLAVHGVTHAFCVPGESYLAVLDALHDAAIPVTVCRQEGGAAMMAEAQGKLTGRPGICFVTRGPGATNASAGIHIAKQDSTPMILFVGQIETGMREREAFQEVDYRAAFGPIAKWATEIDDADRIPEIISRAFHVAMSGRPGPVVIALPENMLVERIAVADALPYREIGTAPAAAEMQEMAALLAKAKAPMVIAGGSRWSPEACNQLMAFAERWSLPVCTTFRRAHLIDALHPCYAGDLGIGPNPKLLARVKDADLIVMIGDRMSEMSSQGYTLFGIPNVQMPLVHVHPGAEELGRVYAPRLAINATPVAFCAALAALSPPPKPVWADTARAAHADYLAFSETATPVPGSVNLGEAICHLRTVLPADAIICNGAGNFAGWIHRFYRFRSFATQLAPTSGSMGYGVPAAVGIKALYRDRPVVCIAGDGDFLMHGQEFMTAVQYALPIIIVVFDNGMYGTIRMHQEREYPGRVVATALKNPDFAAYARAFGGFGVTVTKTADFPAAFKAAQESGQPAIIHLKVDAEGITPSTTLTAIREKALAAKA